MEDPEITALQQIGRIMVPLDPDARRRILDYLQDRWGAQQFLDVDELVETPDAIDLDAIRAIGAEYAEGFRQALDATAARIQAAVDAVATGLANLTRTTQGDGR